jgi:ankyrin repeat protein
MSENDLFEAIRTNDAAVVSALLDGDSALLAARQNGVTPILFAIYNGHADLARLFVDRGATLTFGEACALGDEAQALRMLDADPSLLNAFSEDGFPPVGLAVFFRHPRLATRLVERGADVNAAAQNAFRVAPVHAAAAVRDAATMELLIERGADVNARQQLGYTALHTAAQLGDEVILDLLLAHGADPRAAGDDGKTPADLAAAHGHTQIMKRLTE